MLRSDITFKVTKYVRFRQQKLFVGMFSVMNEFGQIITQTMVKEKKFKDYKAHIEALKQR